MHRAPFILVQLGSQAQERAALPFNLGSGGGDSQLLGGDPSFLGGGPSSRAGITGACPHGGLDKS